MFINAKCYFHGEMGGKGTIFFSTQYVPDTVQNIQQALSHYFLITMGKTIPSSFMGKECEAQ